MNTVGKAGRLSDSIRCVVSVSMLTEGWNTNTVTHVLSLRVPSARSSCAQAVGRVLRRQSFELNSDGLFNVEYADVLASRSISTPSRWWRRRRSRAKPSTSRPCGGARRARNPLSACARLPRGAALIVRTRDDSTLRRTGMRIN